MVVVAVVGRTDRRNIFRKKQLWGNKSYYYFHSTPISFPLVFFISQHMHTHRGKHKNLYEMHYSCIMITTLYMNKIMFLRVFYLIVHQTLHMDEICYVRQWMWKKRKPIVKLLHIRLSNQRKASAFIALPKTEKVELWEKETTEK